MLMFITPCKKMYKNKIGGNFTLLSLSKFKYLKPPYGRVRTCSYSYIRLDFRVRHASSCVNHVVIISAIPLATTVAVAANRSKNRSIDAKDQSIDVKYPPIDGRKSIGAKDRSIMACQTLHYSIMYNVCAMFLIYMCKLI